MPTLALDTKRWWIDVSNPYDWPSDTREEQFGPDWKNHPRAVEGDRTVEHEEDLDLDTDGDWNCWD